MSIQPPYDKTLVNKKGGVRALVLSDTHIPKAAADLPQEIYDAIKDVDLIIHAGDFVEKAVLDKLMGLKRTKAVFGNMDSRDLCATLNQKEVIEVENFKIGLIHGYGSPATLMETVRGEFTKVDAIIFGHSHTPTNTVWNKVLYFNPGSPTDTIFAPYNSYGILEITEKGIEGRILKLAHD
jgi:putative phosphoesterase